MLAYDQDNIKPEVVAKGLTLCARDFTPKVIKKASVAAAGMCQWVHAMITYDKVAKEVEPKRQALKKANEELAEAEKELERGRMNLQQCRLNLLSCSRSFRRPWIRRQNSRKMLKCVLCG